MDVLEAFHGRDQLARVTRRLVRALRPGGLLVFTGCRLPVEVRDGWWAWLLPEGADKIVAYINGRFGMRLVHSEPHHAQDVAMSGYIDHLIAIFEKSQAA